MRFYFQIFQILKPPRQVFSISHVLRLSVRTMSDLADAEKRMSLVEHLLAHLGMEI